MNSLPDTVLNSRLAHSHNLVGFANGIGIVTETDLHVKAVQNKITPALPILVEPMRVMVEKFIRETLPQDSHWMAIKPYDRLAQLVNQLTALVTVGSPLCDDSRYVELASAHTRNGL